MSIFFAFFSFKNLDGKAKLFISLTDKAIMLMMFLTFAFPGILTSRTFFSDIMTKTMHPDTTLRASLNRVKKFIVVAEAAGTASFQRRLLHFVRFWLVVLKILL